MTKISISVLLTVLLLGGCAKVNYHPPEHQAFDKKMIFHASFDEAWAGAVDWFAEHDILIDKIEKTSGLLTAKKKVKVVGGQFLDCGQINISGTLGGKYKLDGYATINLTVHSKGQNETQVMVNLFGKYEFRARDAWNGAPVSDEGDCISTGRLEKNIFSFIANKI